MAGLLSGDVVSPEAQEVNNRNIRPWVVIGVLLMLLLYAYSFTRFYQYVGLPSPRVVASLIGLDSYLSFESGNYLVSIIQVTLTNLFNGNTEREIFFSGLAIAFLAVYFAPVRLKRPFIVTSFLGLMAILYGPLTATGFLAVHLFIFQIFHPEAKHARKIAFASGALAILGFANPGKGLFVTWEYMVAAAILTGLIWRYLFDKFIISLLKKRMGGGVRLAAAHGVLITVWAAAGIEGITGNEWEAPFILVLVFWQWLRLILYGIDYLEGYVPEKLSIWGYLASFMTPAMVPSWGWGVIIGQSYSYQSSCFLSRDKNAIALAGIRLMGIALIYLIFGPLMVEILADFIIGLGIPVYTDIPTMLDEHILDKAVSAPTVLITCLFHEFRWLFKLGGVFHFLVAIWRILGYDVASHIRFPFLATNLVTLWARLMFHFREFLVRVAYYPVFLGLAGKPRWFRVIVATMAAAGLANWLVKRTTEPLFYRGLHWQVLLNDMRSWPFFLLLGAGISITALWITWRGRRRSPWTPGWRLITDVLAVYVTFQYYSLISIFYYIPDSPHGSLKDYVVIFLKGLGIG